MVTRNSLRFACKVFLFHNFSSNFFSPLQLPSKYPCKLNQQQGQLFDRPAERDVKNQYQINYLSYSKKIMYSFSVTMEGMKATRITNLS
jgi:hypothetical protein